MTAPATSRLSRIIVARNDNSSASMVLSLQAVLAAYGRRVSLSELSAVTGDACMLSYAPEAPPQQRWNVYGRHAFLEPAARSYGLSLRELHPPSAAPVPDTPPEFAAHFHDSYQPFVQTALARDEPVLAWMGWPPPREAIWGVVTGIDHAGGVCIGQTMYSGGKPVAMTGPAVQVYLVQDYVPTSPPAEALAAAALQRAALILGNKLDKSLGVVTGPVAWRECGRLLSGADADRSREILVDIVQSTIAGRRAAIGFFQSYPSAVPGPQAKAMQAYAGLFREMIELLQPCIDKAAPRNVFERVAEIENRAAEITVKVS